MMRPEDLPAIKTWPFAVQSSPAGLITPWLVINRLSNNVGGVKHFSSTLQPALREERHFALMDGVAFPTVGSLVIVFQVRNSVRPMHLFGHTFDHDYYFELP
jgi:hypothetical protein